MTSDPRQPPAGEPPRDLGTLCGQLAELAPSLNDVGDWPARQFELLADAGVLTWDIPEEFGGNPICGPELLAAYEQLASACLTTTFILTQRMSAVQRIVASDNEQLRAELLPRLCRNESFATVGISHLTTSRQHVARPAVVAIETGGDFVLTGTVPWVTGAPAADHIVTGGTLSDGRQVLVALPATQAGVTIQQPMRLLALSASRTATVILQDVSVPKQFLLAGPIEQVMKQKGGGAGSLTTSALAIGRTRGILALLAAESRQRPELVPIEQALQSEYRDATVDLYAAAEGNTGASGRLPSAESVRQKANSLVLRASQAFLAASKGAGFVAGHPAERAVREAMFFLVWSCPQPVVSAALREFACVIDG